VDDLGGLDWAAWLGLALVFGIVEVTTLDLTFAMLAAGALAASGVAIFSDNLIVEALVAMVVSVAALTVVRPVALRHLRTPLAIRTGTDALVGQQGLVLEDVDGDTGRVKIKGEIWSARCYDPSSRIEAGRHVEIVQIDGATAVVYESEI
jgi:membrane protein implicated in regulation of membrane protease activity